MGGFELFAADHAVLVRIEPVEAISRGRR